MAETSSSKILTAISEAYLSIVQDISQSIETVSIIAVDCSSDTKQKNCARCLLWFAENQPDVPTQDVIQLCDPACTCRIDKVRATQNIVVNFSAFLSTSSKSMFATQLTNSLDQQASQTSSSNPFNRNPSETSSSSAIDSMYDRMASDSFQSAVQGLTALQTIYLRDAGQVTVVDLNQAITFISKILETNDETKSSLLQLQTSIIQQTTQITKGGLEAVIDLLIQLLLCVVVIGVAAFSLNLILEILSLIN